MTATMEDVPVRRGPRSGQVTLRHASRRWMRQAACLGTDPDLFYDGLSSTAREEAKAVCTGCPVLGTCLARAMEEEAHLGRTPEQNLLLRFGIRGGLTAEERWELAYPEEAAERRR